MGNSGKEKLNTFFFLLQDLLDLNLPEEIYMQIFLNWFNSRTFLFLRISTKTSVQQKIL